jgi:DNA end-binding protein Ku
MYRGTIGFGLVSIPVEVFKAMDDETVPLHWTHRGCGGRIRYRKFCAYCQVEVSPDEVAKAAELEDGRYVEIPSEGLSATALPRDAERTIAIVAFHPLEAVDPILYRAAYWLKPSTGGTKAYSLLREAMDASGLVAVARLGLRGRLHLALVRSMARRTLLMHTLYYPESLRREGLEFGPDAVSTTDKERHLAMTLITHMTEPFKPEAYPNEARHQLLQRIEDLAGEARTPPEEAVPSDLADLMEELKASLTSVSGRG